MTLAGLFAILLAAASPFAPAAAGQDNSHHGDCSPAHGHRDPALAVPGVPFVSLVTAPRRTDTATIVDAVSESRYAAFLSDTVAAFSSRYTLGSNFQSVSTWVRDRFVQAGAPSVELDPYSYSGKTYYNVVASFPGTAGDGRFVLVGAHYDSTSEMPTTKAPGANDNASGTAALLELASVLRDYSLPHGVRLVAFSGEEQGMKGSGAYVSDLLAAGDGDNMVAAVIMDMLSYDEGGAPSVLLESSSAFQSLLSQVGNIAASYTGLEVRTSQSPFGSDHMPFIQNGLPSLLLIENDWDSYPYYHSSNDALTEQDMATGTEITRLAAAALVDLAATSTVQAE
ncbi:MAG: M20/M25/M40 family metallo-hydrolase [Candidatus Schekmanbacteria bacterium]|nr:M20/M25/M40 family metallo-hydrolase [Candidatus Schekmanbacteria bacterium]